MARAGATPAAIRRHNRETIGLVNSSERPALPPLFGFGVRVILLVTLAASTAQAGAFVDDLLRRKMRFSASDLQSLDAGAAVVKSLETPVRRELAHFGVVYIHAPPERFIERFRDIERFESGPGIPQIGRFSVVPRLRTWRR